MSHAGLPRREFLRRGLALAAGACVVRPLAGLTQRSGISAPESIILHLADTHATHHRYPAVLQTVREVLRHYPTARTWIALNGDIFERGDPVSRRSGAWADLAFLRKLRELAPVVWNLGNHDFDILGPVALRDLAQKEDWTLIGNLAHSDLGADGKFGEVTLDGGLFRFAGLGVPGAHLYPAEARDGLTVGDPATTLRQSLAGEDGSFVILSHAGLEEDRGLPSAFGDASAWIVGAHNHQTIAYLNAGTPGYFQHGFGGEVLGVTLVFREGGGVRFEHRLETVGTRLSETDTLAFAAAIEREHAPLFEAGELETVGVFPQSMSLAEGARWAASALRVRTGADFAFLNHTSFGRDFAAGPVRRYDFDRWIRFENNISVGRIDGGQISALLERSNPAPDTPPALRSGDYLHAAAGGEAPQPGKHYRVVTSDWVAAGMNRTRYLPGVDAAFETESGLTVRELVLAELVKTL